MAGALARARGPARRSPPRPHRAHAGGARSALPVRRALRPHPRGREGRRPRARARGRSAPRRARPGRRSSAAAAAPASSRSTSSIPGLLGVLTEYEEHRLRTNIQQGLSLYRLRVQFPLATIDSGARRAQGDAPSRTARSSPTCRPARARDADSIELDILMAAPASARRRCAARSPGASIDDRGGRRAAGRPARPAPAPRRSRTGAARAVRLGARRRRAPALAPAERARRRRPPAAVDRPRPAPASAAGRRRPPTWAPSARSRQTVRVDIRKLDHLMNIVGELAIVRTALARLTERVRARARAARARAPSSTASTAPSSATSRRCRTASSRCAWSRSARSSTSSRASSARSRREHDKQVNLVITGAETEIDKLIVEELTDPLMHMMRNAIDHGIETRDERDARRQAAGRHDRAQRLPEGQPRRHRDRGRRRGHRHPKPRSSAARRAAACVDRGRGARASAAREILTLVFMPGLHHQGRRRPSSPAAASGMDVVKTNIAKLGGVIDIYERGRASARR